MDPEKEVASPEEAIAGARDIIAENISDDADYRSHIRKLTRQKGRLVSKAKDEEAESVYEMYYDFEEPVTKLAGHRILAINRGEKENSHREDRGAPGGHPPVSGEEDHTQGQPLHLPGA